MVPHLVGVPECTCECGGYHWVSWQCNERLHLYAGAVRPLARALKSQSLFKRQSAMQILHKLAQGSKACQLQLEAMLTSQHPEVEKLCTMFEQL